MNRTIEDSKRNYDVVCISFGKEKERGIEVKGAGRKDSFLEQTMEIKAEKCTVKDMGFSSKDIIRLKENREQRRTQKAIERYKQVMGR